MRPFLVLILGLPGLSESAFESVPLPPWQAGGAASSLFPFCASTLFENPASPGLLEGWSVSASASRPYGLGRLDMASLAATLQVRSWAIGAGALASGDDAYSELTFAAAASRRISAGLLAGVSFNIHRLSIDGYGSCGGFSADAGLVSRPMRGVFVGASVRGLVRTDLGESGDPAVPRTVSLAAGVVPVRRIRMASAVSFTEGLDPEPAFMAQYIATDALAIGLGLRSDPARFAVAISLGTGGIDFSYGLGSHPSLGETHSAGIALGRARCEPEPVLAAIPPDSQPTADIPIAINTAGMDQLVLLPGIGPAKAESIIAYRLEHGPFESIDDLLDVPGIGPSLLEAIRPRLVLD